jgi:hypothetical protein
MTFLKATIGIRRGLFHCGLKVQFWHDTAHGSGNYNELGIIN